PSQAKLVVAFLVTMVLSGCSKGLPTDPTAGSTTGGSGKVLATPTATAPTYNWVQIASQWVNKGDAPTVSGSRYKIAFVRAALAQGATVTIMERDPSVPDGIIGPSGTALSKASTLTISYAGCAVENTPDFLKLYRFNSGTSSWDVVAATHDLAAKTFTAKVT